MIEFYEAFSNNLFLKQAVLIGLLASISCGIAGTYVVIKKISFISGSIAHTIIGGIGLILYINKIYSTNISPLWGALFTALFSAILIGLISIHSQQNLDSIIGALWAFGMATGIIFISKTPGYNTDLMSYLFGNILMTSSTDLLLIIILCAITIFMGILFYNKLNSICFDEEFASVKGLRVTTYYLSLLCLIALIIVALIHIVGLILVIALLTIPAAISKMYTKSIVSMMIISIILGLIFTSSGIYFSYYLDFPTSSTIILAATFFYFLAILHKRF